MQIEQVDLDDIRAEHVYHGWLGWLLGYGRVRLDCRLVDDVWLPAMRDPYRLIKASHMARMRHPEIQYNQEDLASNVERIENQRIENTPQGKIGKVIKVAFGKVT